MKYIATIFALFVTLVSFSSAVPAEQLELTWEHPTENEDGSPLPFENIGGYELQYGICGGEQTIIDSSTVGKATTYTIPLPDPAWGKWCVDARTVTVTGVKSRPASVTREIIVPPMPPKMVTINTVVYDTRIHPVQGLVAHRAVGWAALGSECYADPNGMPFVGSDLYGIKPETVALSKQPQSELLVVQCGKT